MKIEVGMYAYIKGKSRDYGVGKIVNIHTNGFYEPEVEIQFKDSKISVQYSKVVGSYKIIDLIQVGDYIEYKQSNMYWNIPTRVGGRYNRQQGLIELMVGEIPLKHVEVTSVVTREQMEELKYKAGEEDEKDN